MSILKFIINTALSGFILMFIVTSASANCGRFSASTMEFGSGPKASWRTDYPDRPSRVEAEWLSVNFKRDPQKYMEEILETVRPEFEIREKRLVGNGEEQWWMSLWMDYTTSGRERSMGLTKERGPDTGDLAPNSSDTYQVWAVGFYNSPGASSFGDIYEDPCDPSLPVALQFPRNTVSIKFLFTDADPSEVKYLMGAPEFSAWIDVNSGGGVPEKREERIVRLMQLDVAAKDSRAETGWVFGTFGWVGPRKGDGLFDNLVPVSLQWGNDPKVYNQAVMESWINPNLNGVMFGWKERPTLGFNGRANGPADNIRSSCLSCHASARTPAASRRLLDSRFDMTDDILDPEKVISHIDVWFKNQTSKGLFKPNEPAVSTLDYSLQLENSIFRMCRACRAGDLSGSTPSICRETGFHNRKTCNVAMRANEASGAISEGDLEQQKSLRTAPPARQ